MGHGQRGWLQSGMQDVGREMGRRTRLCFTPAASHRSIHHGAMASAFGRGRRQCLILVARDVCWDPKESWSYTDLPGGHMLQTGGKEFCGQCKPRPSVLPHTRTDMAS